MKKRFFDPEAQIIELLVGDIVTASSEGEDIFDDGGEVTEPEEEFGK
ncbi:MAG: hypothetical protein IJZ75_01585 [Clostridia bacterium]|nr:hypothetical protein [Clostridia bacterium]